MRDTLLLLALAISVAIASPTLYWSKPVLINTLCPPSPTLIEVTCPVTDTWTCASLGVSSPLPSQLLPAIDLVGSHFKDCRRLIGESLLGLYSHFDKTNNILTFYGGSSTTCLGMTSNYTQLGSETMAVPLQFVQRKCFQLSIASPPTYSASGLCFTVNYMFSSSSSDNCMNIPKVLSLAPELSGLSSGDSTTPGSTPSTVLKLPARTCGVYKVASFVDSRYGPANNCLSFGTNTAPTCFSFKGNSPNNVCTCVAGTSPVVVSQTYNLPYYDGVINIDVPANYTIFACVQK